jgi:hypothetical protein
MTSAGIATYTRKEQKMNDYSGPDEYPIKQIPATPKWNETFAAMFCDPVRRLAVFYHIGRWHGDFTLWREVVMVSLPDKRTLYNKGYGRGPAQNGPGGSLSFFTVEEPGKRMRLTFDGPVSSSSVDELIEHGARQGPAERCVIDLRFESDAPLWNMKGNSAEASSIAGSVHIDQIGKANGTVTYDGMTYKFADGYSIRDHSRGIRDVTRYGAHCWISGIFPDRRGFYLYAMRLWGDSSAGMMNAMVTQDDRLYPATLLHTDFADRSTGAGSLHKILLDCELGTMEIEVIEVLNTFPSCFFNPFDTAPGWIRHHHAAWELDEPVRLRWRGQEGIGWSERAVASGPL